MAVSCPNCKEVEHVQAGLRTQKCGNCNTEFDFEGNVVEPHGQVNLVGNYADLQRLGQQVVGNGSNDSAFVIPQGTDPKQAEKETKEQLKGQAEDGLVNTPPGASATASVGATTKTKGK